MQRNLVNLFANLQSQRNQVSGTCRRARYQRMQRKQRCASKSFESFHDLIVFQLALELHIHILWGLPDQNSIPPMVTLADKLPFTHCFSSETSMRSSVTASLDANTNNIYNAHSRVQALLASLQDGSSISNNIKHMRKIICYLFSVLSQTLDFTAGLRIS